MNTRPYIIQPPISVIICTHNRLRYLRTVIESLDRQHALREVCEIIVVDNASSDGTWTWLQGARHCRPNLLPVAEPVLGLAQARNTGWQRAQAPLVAFLDDDAIAADDWLAQIAATFARHNNQVAMIGGKVEPIWEVHPPPWLIPDYWPFLTVVDLGPHELFLAPEQLVVGANLVIRRKVLVELGGFDPQLGRKGANLLSNEEVQFRQAVEHAGYRVLYSPTIAVTHIVQAERMTPAWFRRRFYWQGISNAIMERQHRLEPYGLHARVRGMWLCGCAVCRLLVRRLKLAVCRPSDHNTAMRALLLWQQDLGYIVGRWRVLIGAID